MASSSTPKFSNIALTKEEADGIYTPDWDFEEDPTTILIGHLLSSKPVDDGTVLTAFEGIWRNNNLISISVIKESYFRIKFATSSDRKDVFERGPWLYKLEWLALAEYDPVKNVDEYSFTMMRIWLRILTIPASFVENIDRAHMVGQSLGAIVGTALRTDTRKENGNMSAFLRVEIMVDTSRPIRQFLLIGKGNNQKSCQLQYERLPVLCHGCGIVCHTIENCPNKSAYDPNNLQYGDWLRYLPPRRRDQGPRGRIRVVDHTTSAQNLPSMATSEKGKVVAAQNDSGNLNEGDAASFSELPSEDHPQKDETMAHESQIPPMTKETDHAPMPKDPSPRLNPKVTLPPRVLEPQPLNTIFPIPEESAENDLVNQDINISSPNAQKILDLDAQLPVAPGSVPTNRGTKRRSPIQVFLQTKKAKASASSTPKDKDGMSSSKNSSAVVDTQPRRGK